MVMHLQFLHTVSGKMNMQKIKVTNEGQTGCGKV